MSRSYKKSPVYTDRPHGAKYWKRVSNKKVRRYKGKLANGKAYKKIYDSWEIHDYISYWTKQEAINDYYMHSSSYNPFWFNWQDEYPTLEKYLNHIWEHDYHRK